MNKSKVTECVMSNGPTGHRYGTQGIANDNLHLALSHFIYSSPLEKRI